MPRIHWERLPNAQALPAARDWLQQAAGSGLAAPTIDAYSRAVEGYLAYCRERRLQPHRATTAHIAAYLDELAAHGLRGATLLQRLTAIRLFYAFVVERREVTENPASGLTSHAGRPRPGEPAVADGATVWLPDDLAWTGVLTAASRERPRTRVMLALAYDAALRREELCRLRIADLDLDRRILRVPPAAGTGRTVGLSPSVARCCAAYLRTRAGAGDEALFLSESPRNRAQPLTIWTWSKVVRAIARRAGDAPFTTHTPRHLRLTDLARAGWSARAIAHFAGHRGVGLARRYLRLAEVAPAPPGQDLLDQRAAQLSRILFGERP